MVVLCFGHRLQFNIHCFITQLSNEPWKQVLVVRWEYIQTTQSREHVYKRQLHIAGMMTLVLSFTFRATWSHGSNNVLWDFSSSVLVCLLSFVFILFWAVSSAVLWSDFKSSFALIKAESSETSWSMRCCRSISSTLSRNHGKCLPNVCWFYQLKWFLFLMDLTMAKLIKLDKMAGAMHEADHAYSIRSTWWLHRLATDVPLIACVINLPCTFAHYLELSNFYFYFMIWIAIL